MRESKQPHPSDYRPYDRFPAFEAGISDYMAGKYHNPFDGRPEPRNQVNAQAWDRGAEYAMRVMRWSNQRTADHIDGYDRDDLGESPDY